MRDWNNDGKIDSRDGFIDYMIFEEVTKDSNNDNTSYSSSGAGDGATMLGVGLLIFGIIVLIGLII